MKQALLARWNSQFSIRKDWEKVGDKTVFLISKGKKIGFGIIDKFPKTC